MAVGALLLLLSAATASAQSTDPLALFSKMMPVFSGPRCANCHGRTDPVSGANHGGGAVASALVGGRAANCVECHTALSDTGDSPWELATLTRWGIKPEREVCRDIADFVRVVGPGAFLRHLSTDPLIGLAFEGLKGIDTDSPMWPVEEEPPPLERSEFVQLANVWVTQGHAQCGSGWSGSINFTETASSISPGYDAGSTTTVDITLVNGQASARLVDKRHETSESPGGVGCPSFRHNTGSAASDGPIGVSVDVTADGYRISFNVPTVTGKWQIETLNVGSCNAGRVSRVEQYRVDTGYTAQGKLDSDDPKQLKGSLTDTRTSQTTRTITWDLVLED
jgi:hypothetical protein